MKISLEVSDIDSYQTIGGLTEPVIGQRKIDHEIRMRDGEVSLIGGMMEHDDVRNMSGLPWVSQIPILKYLFGQGQKSKTDTETVFALMPHIVRRLDIDEMNMRGVDIGTQNVVEIRHLSKTPATVAPTATVPSGSPSAATAGQSSQGASPQGAANSVASATPNQAANVASSAAASPGASPAASFASQASELGPVLSLDPPMVNQATGGTFALNVILNGGQNVFSVPVQIHYDPNVLRFVNVSNAGALSKDGAAVALVNRDDAEKGVLTVSLARPPGTGGISPTGPLFTLVFMGKAAGQGTVSVGRAVLRDPNNSAIEASGSQAIINVR
jgi:general secretion pathway protein D